MEENLGEITEEMADKINAYSDVLLAEISVGVRKFLDYPMHVSNFNLLISVLAVCVIKVVECIPQEHQDILVDGLADNVKKTLKIRHENRG